MPRIVETNDIGAKVVRGRDWDWRSQDKDSTYGIIIEGPPVTNQVRVQWQNGQIFYYRVGNNSKYDLYYYEGDEEPVGPQPLTKENCRLKEFVQKIVDGKFKNYGLITQVTASVHYAYVRWFDSNLFPIGKEVPYCINNGVYTNRGIADIYTVSPEEKESLNQQFLKTYVIDPYKQVAPLEIQATSELIKDLRWDKGKPTDISRVYGIVGKEIVSFGRRAVNILWKDDSNPTNYTYPRSTIKTINDADGFPKLRLRNVSSSEIKSVTTINNPVKSKNKDGTKTTSGYIIEVPRQITTIREGKRPDGHPIQGKTGRTTVELGHLSYRTVSE